MKTVIMAGGKGTRISTIAPNIPKPMILIEGKPVLEHQIACLKEQGFTDIIISIGYLGDVIQDYFNDGSSFGVNIQYYSETKPLGTAGALYYLKSMLTEDFILLNGDILFNIEFKRLTNFHGRKNALATIFTHPNDHPFDSAIIIADEESRVTEWLHKEDPRKNYKNRVNAGIHILSPILIEKYLDGTKKDLDRDILKPLIADGGLFAYDSPEYVKDMGTPDRFNEIIEDFLSGKVRSKNLQNKQKAIFLDRDGTINIYRGFINKPEQVELIPGVAEAIENINKSDFLAIVITNQPVVARGDCTFRELEEIHNRLETLLGEKGAYLDAIYFCPHHPDKGFIGERPELKIECECRKPKAGLVNRAIKDYNISIKESFFVGDSITDVLTGKAAGCKTVLLSDSDKNAVESSTFIYRDLKSFVQVLLSLE